MGARRKLIAALSAGVALVGCSSSSPPDETVAPTVGRGTREDPPPGILPPSSGSTGSTGGFTQVDGCPATRTAGAAMSPLTKDDVRALVVGIHRSCQMPEALEIRIDDETGELHWYRLDDRYVRRLPPGFDGPLEIDGCVDDHCTVNWVEPDVMNPVTTVFRLSLWREPTALVLQERGRATSEEWVRVAD